MSFEHESSTRARAERVAAAVDPERRRGALVRLSCETDFVAFTADFRRLCAALALTSARLRTSRIEDVCAATLTPSGGAAALDDLSRRCGEELRVESVELFQSADMSGAATLEDGSGAVLVQFLGAAPRGSEADACERLARHALNLEDAARRRVPLPRDPAHRERWVLDQSVLDRLHGEHARGVQLTRLIVRWVG